MARVGDPRIARLVHRLGTEAKPFLAQKWEEGWDRPLAEWRTKLNVRSTRSGQFIDSTFARA